MRLAEAEPAPRRRPRDRPIHEQGSDAGEAGQVLGGLILGVADRPVPWRLVAGFAQAIDMAARVVRQ